MKSEEDRDRMIARLKKTTGSDKNPKWSSFDQMPEVDGTKPGYGEVSVGGSYITALHEACSIGTPVGRSGDNIVVKLD